MLFNKKPHIFHGSDTAYMKFMTILSEPNPRICTKPFMVLQSTILGKFQLAFQALWPLPTVAWRDHLSLAKSFFTYEVTCE